MYSIALQLLKGLILSKSLVAYYSATRNSSASKDSTHTISYWNIFPVPPLSKDFAPLYKRCKESWQRLAFNVFIISISTTSLQEVRSDLSIFLLWGKCIQVTFPHFRCRLAPGWRNIAFFDFFIHLFFLCTIVTVWIVCFRNAMMKLQLSRRWEFCKTSFRPLNSSVRLLSFLSLFWHLLINSLTAFFPDFFEEQKLQKTKKKNVEKNQFTQTRRWILWFFFKCS